MIYYDLETKGFYDPKVNLVIPSNAKKITQNAYDFFMANNGEYFIDNGKALKVNVITMDEIEKIIQPEALSEPTETEILTEYLLDLDYRLILLEMGV